MSHRWMGLQGMRRGPEDEKEHPASQKELQEFMTQRGLNVGIIGLDNAKMCVVMNLVQEFDPEDHMNGENVMLSCMYRNREELTKFIESLIRCRDKAFPEIGAGSN